jgi:hypothetical protein
MKNIIIFALFPVCIGLLLGAHVVEQRKLRNDIWVLEQNAQAYDKMVEAHVAETKRLEACALRQIASLIQICEANDIRLAQNIETSEWVEGPKPLTPAELEEFRDAWLQRLETGISPMSGRPISLNDPLNGPTVALIAGLKAGRHVRQTLEQTELEKAREKIHQLEETIEVHKLAGREVHKLIKALDKFVIEHPEVADDFPRHPFRVADEADENDHQDEAPTL